MNRRTFLSETSRACFAAGLVSISGCATRRRQIVDRDEPADPFASRLLRLVPELMKEAQAPGCSIALIKNGRLLWRRGFGVKNASTQEPVDTDTVFEAASISKTVFSYAVLKLAEQGIIELDAPLTRYATKPLIEGDPRLELINARRVLSHTAGFQDWRSTKEPLAIHFTPGEQFMYSGEGYFYLQSVISHLVGHENPNECAQYEAGIEVCATDIDTTLKKRVLRPFGMTSSTYLWNALLARHAASPHDSDGKPFAKQHPTASAAARYASAGGLHTTPTDYAAFLLEIINPKPPDSFRLTKASLEEMVRPQVKLPADMHIDGATSWALGWAVQERSSGNVIVHSGGQTGFQALTMASVPRKCGFIILTNSNNGWKVFDHPEFEKAMDELLDG